MIFNEQYNRLIYLMSRKDRTFSDDLATFVADLPITIRNRCKRMRPFTVNRKNYKYVFDEYDDNELELMVETEVSFDHALNLYKLSEEDLTQMKSMTKNDFCVFETTREDGECLGYLWYIKKIDDAYYICMDVTSSNPESDRSIEEEISLVALISNIKVHKR